MGGALRTPLRTLPENTAPSGKRCINFEIPDDDEWERAAFSALYSELAMWYVWQRDTGHNGAVVARIWRAALRTWKHCDNSPSPVQHGAEIEDFMPLRVDCDCRVFVTCCDGTEKELVTTDMIGAPTQPGGGTPQPPPGGGTQCYPVILNASSRWFVPTLLNTGDVVTINDGKGAVANSHNINWRCFSGSQFFGGACVGSPQTFGTDPVPTANNGTLVIEIDGTFYSLASGTFTVPGGISNAPSTIQINDATIAGLDGQFTFNACVTNNQASAWHHVIDFKVTDGGFSRVIFGGYGTTTTWIAGVGWQANSDVVPGDPTRQQTSLQMERAMSGAFVIAAAQVTFNTDEVGGAGAPTRAIGTNLHTYTIPDGVGAQTFSQGGTDTNPNNYFMVINTSTNDGSDNGVNTVTKLDIAGTGTDPWPDLP